MAEKLKIKRSTYQYWEQKTPSIDKIKEVARVLNLPVDYFFGNTDEKNIVNEPEIDYESRRTLERTLENLSEDKIRSTAIIERLVTMLEKQFSSGVLSKPQEESFGPENNRVSPGFAPVTPSGKGAQEKTKNKH
jgi:transcriptional regulator with XRE-family HTH domain